MKKVKLFSQPGFFMILSKKDLQESINAFPEIPLFMRGAYIILYFCAIAACAAARRAIGTRNGEQDT